MAFVCRNTLVVVLRKKRRWSTEFESQKARFSIPLDFLGFYLCNSSELFVFSKLKPSSDFDFEYIGKFGFWIFEPANVVLILRF